VRGPRAFVIAVAAALAAAAGQPAVAGALAFVAPWITLTHAERARLQGDDVIAKVVPSRHGQAGVFVASRLHASAEALAAWTHQIAAFKRSRFVQAIGRFSEPPALHDLRLLSLDDADVHAVRRCRPGDCALKLTASEIATLAAAHGGSNAGDAAIQQAFRQVILDRVLAYRAGGLAALPPIVDDHTPRPSHEAFAALLQQSPYLERLPALRRWLEDYPHAGGDVESFFYWSKEHYGSGKPVVSVTHVGIVRPPPAPDRPAIVVAGKQILATHYVQASLGLTMVMPGGSTGGSYLVYLNRTSLDVLGGFIGALARGTLERRMARQAPLVVRGLRERLESGAPPAGAGSGRDGHVNAARALRPCDQPRLQFVEPRRLCRQQPAARDVE
jgi:hypothetical protein